MNISEYLYENSQFVENSLMKNYNKCLVDGLSFKNIYKEMFETYIPENVELFTYKGITNKFDNHNMFKFKR